MIEKLRADATGVPYPEHHGEQIFEPAEIILRDAKLYHGSATAQIEQLNVAEEDTVGEGVYFVDNPADAARYALRRSRRDANQPVVYEAFVREARIANLDNADKLQETMQEFKSALMQEDRSRLSWSAEGAVLRAVDTIGTGVRPGNVKSVAQVVGRRFTEYLQTQGYDGLKTTEGGEGEDIGNHTTYLIFDPHKAIITDSQIVSPEQDLVSFSSGGAV